MAGTYVDDEQIVSYTLHSVRGNQSSAQHILREKDIEEEDVGGEMEVIVDHNKGTMRSRRKRRNR
jgi:hypothetical protein